MLALEGYNSEIGPAKRGSKEAMWTFEHVDGLDAVVASYVGGSCRVEPKEFMQSLTKTRKDLHDFRNSTFASAGS